MAESMRTKSGSATSAPRAGRARERICRFRLAVRGGVVGGVVVPWGGEGAWGAEGVGVSWGAGDGEGAVVPWDGEGAWGSAGTGDGLDVLGTGPPETTPQSLTPALLSRPPSCPVAVPHRSWVEGEGGLVPVGLGDQCPPFLGGGLGFDGRYDYLCGTSPLLGGGAPRFHRWRRPRRVGRRPT